MKAMIKELCKKTIIVISVFFILLSSIIPPQKVFAAVDVSVAGETMAQFAINFHRDYADEVKYDTSYSCRQLMYNGEKCSHGCYHCDCVGWISFVVHQALSLETGGDDGGESNFIQPADPDSHQTGFSPSGHFEVVYGNFYSSSKKSVDEIVSNALPGDVILAKNHVMLYIGNGEIIHCANGLQREKLSASAYTNKLYGVARLTKDAAASINSSDCTTIFGMNTGSGELDDYGLYWGTTTGRYTGSYTLGDWLFSTIAGFLDYIIGMMLYTAKIPFLGWTNIIETMVNRFLQDLTGDEMRAVTHEEDLVEEDIGEDDESEEESSEIIESISHGTKVVLNDEEKLYKPTVKIENWDRVTIEDIIFNHIPILDIDIFSFEEAAGQKLSEESIIYTIRQNIASWYLVIRNTAISIMLLILVYLGIRLAITTSSEKKANYKGMIMSWLSGLLIIFVIHYYMIIVITLNQEFLKIFENVSFGTEEINEGEEEDEEDEDEIYAAQKGKTQSLYDTIRTRAYSFKFTEGVPGTIIYIVLVYYMIKYLYIYFKRYLTVNILAIIAPAIGAKYAYDRVHRGKGGSVTTWMFDFFVNVFLQTIHALIYTVFVSIIINLSTQSLAGFAMSLLVLNFMNKAEKIFINIFKFESRGSSLAETRDNDFRRNASEVVGFAMFAANTPKTLMGGAKFVGKYTESFNNMVGFGIHSISNLKKPKEDREKYEYINLKDQAKKVGSGAAKFGKAAVEVIGNTKPVKAIGDEVQNVASIIDEIDKIKKIRNFTSKLSNDYKENNIRYKMKKYKKSNPEKYDKMKKALDTARKQRKEQHTRMLKTGMKAVTGVARVFAGVPMFIAEGEAGALVLSTGISALRELSDEQNKLGYREDRKRKNIATRVADITTLGLYSASSNEIRKTIKDMKINEEMLDKLNALSEMSSKEDEIDGIMEEINELENQLLKEIEQRETDEQAKKEAQEEERKERRKRLNDTVVEAASEVIKGDKIKEVIDDYMYEHSLERLSESDINSIIKRLSELAGTPGVKIEFDSEFVANVKKMADKKINSRVSDKKTFSKKEAVDVFEDAIVTSGSVKSKHEEKSKGSENPESESITSIRGELEKKYASLKQSVKEMHAITEKAKVRTGSSAGNPESYIRKSNARIIAEKIRKEKEKKK